jgi:hypothetical protein
MNDKVTIDLDFKTKSEVTDIMMKILHRSCCINVTRKPSFCKGEHLIITCKKPNCNLCRFVFDDCNRFAMDSRRKNEEQNVLWESARSLKGVAVKPTTSNSPRDCMECSFTPCYFNMCPWERHSPEPKSPCRL